jgi:hypothetical protein
MSFIEPALLWSALAVAIPIAIHFWHQKQGKPLPWAAMQWLTEEQQQQSRGFQFDNIWLLIIRCLLLVLLAILLAQPILNWLAKPPVVQKVHLVQPTASVAANFRFELTEAQKKGERVLWANDRLEPLNDPSTSTQQSASFNPLLLQTAINKLDPKNTELHLYLINNQSLAEMPVITVPNRFQLHTLTDSTTQSRAYLTGRKTKKLFINQVGKLTSSLVLDPAVRFGPTAAHSGPILTLLNYKNNRERQTVRAALTALVDVYDFDLAIDEKPVSTRIYNWILTDQLPSKLTAPTLYIVSGITKPTTSASVQFTNETLTPQTSDRVATGQLPEWLGEQLLNFYGLMANQPTVNQQDIKALFVASTKPSQQQQAGLQNALLALFVVLVLIERWLALTKNA